MKKPFVVLVFSIAMFSCVKGRGVAVPMVRISGGTFMMGSPADEPERFGDESPQHQVTVSSFYIGSTEVTQKEYQELMGQTPAVSKVIIFRWNV